MRSWRFVWIVPILALVLDLYVFQAIKTVSQGASPRMRSTIHTGYWVISILAILILCFLPYLYRRFTWLQGYAFFILIGFYLAKILVAVFLLLDDVRRVIQWIAGRLLAGSGPAPALPTEGVSRSIFMSWLGLGVGAGLYSTLVYGFANKYRYRVRRVRLAFDNLPVSFKGLKIVQLSDIHSGSLANPAAVRRGVDLVLAEKPDIILFTGDLVNNIALEVGAYQAIFGCLDAPMGVYSTLGNHDYGDYSWWENAETKKANLDHLMRIQKEMGWRLLMNEHVVLERGSEQIALIGVENWSAKARFPKYGKLDEAYAGAEKYPFKILMSHDPSHWDAQVRKEYPDIDLMLSGHTHGMQFGLELPGFKWSPVQYIYKEWAGLYEEGKQKLYVNRGFGFIGYPGRVGIMPEITVIELA
ncbi:MAG TPA: metallophosphoesterase [Puia sp.]|jgi:predicted MPP superfamily phosphohydrolase|nr:metallophosphoesterase [Puia sp.]